MENTLYYGDNLETLQSSPGWNKDYPRLQILTIEDLLSGKKVQRPPISTTFKEAKKHQGDKATQLELLGDKE